MTATQLNPDYVAFAEKFATQVSAHTFDRERIQSWWEITINPDMNIRLKWMNKEFCPELEYVTHFSSPLLPRGFGMQDYHKLTLQQRIPLWRKGLLELNETGGVFENNFGLLVRLTAFLNSP